MVDRPASRPTTFAAHGYLLKNHILPRLGDRELSDITPEELQHFLEDCKWRGNHRSTEPLKQETLRHILSLTSKVLSRAEQDGFIAQNPAKGMVILARNEPLSDWEMEEYLDAAEELEVLPIFLLALEHGLRQRELIALKWSDLDEQSRTLTIRMHRTVEYGGLVEYEGPTRTVTLSEPAAAELKKLRSRFPSSQAMFVHPGTLKPYSPGMIRRLHSKVLERAGLPPIRFIDLRHTYSVRALEEGRTVKEIAANLGHTRLTTTRKCYRKYLPQNADHIKKSAAKRAAAEQKQAAKQLGKLFALG